MSIKCVGTYGEPPYIINEDTSNYADEGDVLKSFTYRNEQSEKIIKNVQIVDINMRDVTLETIDGAVTISMDNIKDWEKYEFNPLFYKEEMRYVGEYNGASNSYFVKCMLSRYAGRLAIFEFQNKEQKILALSTHLNVLKLEMGKEYFVMFEKEDITNECNRKGKECYGVKMGKCVKHIYNVSDVPN